MGTNIAENKRKRRVCIVNKIFFNNIVLTTIFLTTTIDVKMSNNVVKKS